MVLDMEGPGGSGGAMNAAVGFGIVDELFLGGIKGEFAPELPGEFCGEAGNVRATHNVLVTGGLGAAPDAVKEVAAVAFGACARLGKLTAHGLGDVASEDDFAIIACFYGALVSFESDWAGPGRSGVVRVTISEGFRKEVANELHAIFIYRGDACLVSFVG